MHTFYRDVSDASILDDFEASLERTLRGQLTVSGLYMGMFFLPFSPSLLTVKLYRDKSVVTITDYCQTSRCHILVIPCQGSYVTN